jgi:hypothetical protein
MILSISFPVHKNNREDNQVNPIDIFRGKRNERRTREIRKRLRQSYW